MKRTLSNSDDASTTLPKRQRADKGGSRNAKNEALRSKSPASLDVATPEMEFKQVTSAEFAQYQLPMSGADVYYQPELVDEQTATTWYEQLDALETWYQPTLKVYGKSIMQSRAIAAYATDPDLTLKYSGQTVTMNYPYPTFLKDIQMAVEAALGISFNHVMLNRYEDGQVYIGKHSDHIDNKVIASLSLGAERTFIMTPRKGFSGRARKWVLRNGSVLVMQGDTQRNWKHEIPKEPHVTKGRISLTFRQMTQS